VSKARVLAAVSEAVGAEEAGRIAGMKKADMAEAAERLLEGRGWLAPGPRAGGGAAAISPVRAEAARARRRRGEIERFITLIECALVRKNPT